MSEPETTEPKRYWNYRVLRDVHKAFDGVDEETFGIHEVHYEDGKVVGWTRDPSVVGDTVAELKSSLSMMREALTKPVLDPEALREALKTPAVDPEAVTKEPEDK